MKATTAKNHQKQDEFVYRRKACLNLTEPTQKQPSRLTSRFSSNLTKTQI
ncbi:hypothetical protein CSUNSWCD_2063 [Campylobacter showae CSUNSWCD]|uniref:Uncharacterized protein n=1 Tax=Campylobacter showae CSUNSWCD TaxID=1244083 RepID=M5IG50_9BACT|nr:hypothetical protein CSUNSWCD_2063 [Campylobacter showae CSUNSWCD]